MFSKGADSVIKDRLHASYHDKLAVAYEQLAKTDKFLEMASCQGYRTLLVGFRAMTSIEVQ